MPSRRSLVFIVAMLCLLMAVPALAWNEAKLKAQVQELLDQAAAGFVKKDMQAVAATSAPQASIKYPDGRAFTMAQWREQEAREIAGWKDISSRFVVEKVWPKGKDQAGSLYRERHEYSLVSDPGHRYAISARFQAILTKTPQGWRFLEFKGLSIAFTRDGKPFHPRAAAVKPRG